MTEQHPIGDHTFGESLRARSRWRVRSDHTNLTGSPSGGFTLTRALGTLLVVLILWVGQHPWPVEDPALTGISRVPTEGQLQHRELNTHATYDAVADQRATMVSLSVPLPPPPVPPAPAPVVPAPVVPVRFRWSQPRWYPVPSRWSQPRPRCFRLRFWPSIRCPTWSAMI